MFWRILKKDLKRKKTMNIILLLFVVLCSMLAAASVNNMKAVTSGIDDFIKMSDAPDIIMEMPYDSDYDDKVREMSSVNSVKIEKSFFLMPDNLTLNGEKMDKAVNGSEFVSDEEFGVKYFDTENKEIASVPKGSFYCTKNFFNNIEAGPGDVLVINSKSKKVPLRYEGNFKTCADGTESSSSATVILNSADWNDINEDLDDLTAMRGKEMFIKTSDTQAVIEAAEEWGLSYSEKSELPSLFLYDKITAYILVAVCVILVITSFAALRFAIGFTISEEFREIGVMKAVGIGNRSIRGLYIAKYTAIAVIGSVIGYAASIPFADLLLRSISKNIVFDNNNALLGAFGSAAVVLTMILFCYGCTGGIKKLTPIDAVRSGQTGERYGKKSVMHLGRSRLPATGFLAMNDVMSAPKQFIIITAVFTLCVLMMTIMSNCATTLSSDKPISLFAVPENTDVTILDMELEGSNETLSEPDGWKKLISNTETMLTENGIPGKCTVTMGTVCPTVCGDKTDNISYIVTKNVSADSFLYDEGTAPRKTDECAMTDLAMEAIGAQIGDRVKMTIANEEREYLITGSFSSFMANGKAARLCENDTIDYKNMNNFMGVQIEFDGDPDEEQTAANIKKLEEAAGTTKTYTNAELVDYFTSMSGTLDAIKKVMMIVTVIVTALIVILMERSLVSKEKSEIALMKAVGLRGGSIIGQHVMRFVLAALIAVCVASAAVLPISKALINFIFSMIGSVKGCDIAFNAVEIFAVCPAILLGVTLVGTFLTSLCTKSIKAADTASIE